MEVLSALPASDATAAPPMSDAADATEHFGAAFVEQSNTIRAEIQKDATDAITEARQRHHLHGHIMVCVRIRPTLDHERALLGQRIPGMSGASFAQFDYESCLCDRRRQEICVLTEKRKIGKPTGGLNQQRFRADDVFGDGDDNDAVFEGALAPLIDDVANGGSAALIAYGSTGTGKTFTCTAMQLNAVRALLASAAGTSSSVTISFYELCGERCSDLLAPAPAQPADGTGDDGTGDDGTGDDGGDGAPRVALAMRETPSGELAVCGLRRVAVRDVAEAEAVLHAANAARACAPTASNERSSRSHAMCSLQLCRGRGGLDGATAEGSDGVSGGADGVGGGSGQLLIVDLAGSERREDVGKHDKARMEETRATNVSLSVLKDCVRLRREGKGGGLVPYRRSKLTRLLRPYFEGAPTHGADGSGGGAKCTACVIAHLSPLRSGGKHTASTLEFVGALCGVTRAAQERVAFNKVERWTPDEVKAWVSALDGGKFAHLARCFGGFTGKMLSIEWLGHVVKRVAAEGGAEADAHRIYEAFHELHQAAKREQAAAAVRPKGKARTAHGTAGGGAAAMAQAELEMKSRGGEDAVQP